MITTLHILQKALYSEYLRVCFKGFWFLFRVFKVCRHSQSNKFYNPVINHSLCKRKLTLKRKCLIAENFLNVNITLDTSSCTFLVPVISLWQDGHTLPESSIGTTLRPCWWVWDPPASSSPLQSIQQHGAPSSPWGPAHPSGSQPEMQHFSIWWLWTEPLNNHY